jgi:hypothetical protein
VLCRKGATIAGLALAFNVSNQNDMAMEDHSARIFESCRVGAANNHHRAQHRAQGGTSFRHQGYMTSGDRAPPARAPLALCGLRSCARSVAHYRGEAYVRFLDDLK